MKTSRLLAFATASTTLLGACVSGPTVKDPAAVNSLVAQECAIYIAAEQQMGTPNSNLSAGCPAGIAPANITATGTPGMATQFSEILFQRMIARGMPSALATQVSTSPAFKELVAFQAANAT